MELNATIINKRRTTEVWYGKKRVSKCSDYGEAMVRGLLAIGKIARVKTDRAYATASMRFDKEFFADLEARKEISLIPAINHHEDIKQLMAVTKDIRNQ